MIETLKPKSWYVSTKKFTRSQLGYITLLQESFFVKDAYGNPILYNMTDYQKDFHADSFNILGAEAKDIIFIKARGISFTTSSAIELIMTGAGFNDQIIPVISQRFESGAEILDLCKWLIENCKIKEIRENVEFTASEIKFKLTNSVIKVYPSSSAADAIRGKRLIRALIDELAFQEQDKKLWASLENCFAHGIGQILAGSTPCGRNNLFFELISKARLEDIGFIKYELPVFKFGTFNSKIPIPEQPHLVPIAPWLNLQKLEDKRKRDWRIFEQEQMASFLDDGISFITFEKIMRCVNEKLFNYKEKLYTEYVYLTTNRLFIGVDVAEKTDYFAVTVWEEIISEEGKVKMVQRFLDYFNGLDTPALETYLNEVMRMFPNVFLMRIDKTGMGTGLTAYMKRSFPYQVEGINFASTIRVEGREKGKIRQVMIINVKKMIEEQMVELLADNLQTAHINAIDYSFEIAKGADGHGDILFSIALALLPSKYSINPSMNASTTLKSSNENINPNALTVSQKMDWYKQQAKSKRFL